MTSKKATQKSSASTSSASDSAPPLQRLLDAALAEAAALGWPAVTLDAVAARAGLPLGEALLTVPSKLHLVLALLRRLDERTLAPVKSIASADTPRDRLFELLMRRFDALNEQREGARAVVAGVARDPLLALAVLCRAERSAAALLAAAGISASGFAGLARIKGLKAVAACGLRAWMSDDSSDLAKTMAAVDRALARAEKLAGFFAGRRASKENDSEGDAQARA